MGWVCTVEFPLCVFLPFIIHASSFSKLLFGTHSGTNNIIYVLWLLLLLYLPSLYWQETRVLLVFWNPNGVQKLSFSFWERHPLSWNVIVNCTVINGVLVLKISLSQWLKYQSVPLAFSGKSHWKSRRLWHVPEVWTMGR